MYKKLIALMLVLTSGLSATSIGRLSRSRIHFEQLVKLREACVSPKGLNGSSDSEVPPFAHDNKDQNINVLTELERRISMRLGTIKASKRRGASASKRSFTDSSDSEDESSKRSAKRRPYSTYSSSQEYGPSYPSIMSSLSQEPADSQFSQVSGGAGGHSDTESGGEEAGASAPSPRVTRNERRRLLKALLKEVEHWITQLTKDVS